MGLESDGQAVVDENLNVIGIKVAARANFLLMALQLLVLGIFVVLCLGYFVRGDTGARRGLRWR